MLSAQRLRAEIEKFKRQLRGRNPVAAGNIATTYRQLGNHRLALHWWKRAAVAHQGGAWPELGYAYQYGIGTRANQRAAINAYRKAIGSNSINVSDMEEAQYHLAIALLDRSVAGDRRDAERLLGAAAADGDYDQAEDLLKQLASVDDLNLCRCRRGLARSLGGQSQCSLHRSKKRR
jgi:TPR repeat protein